MFSSVCKAVVPLSVSAEMTNFRKLRDADIAKMVEASDSEEENVSEYENHTSDEVEGDSSDNDFDIGIQQRHNIQNIQSKNHETQ
ncbi:hypothetical protein NPIL_424091 [Nephila pilipes]|uniref:Uncharacterized protein n=1 Tax=Nephila pilipes TaxID=299642 RepID=A0A8X6UUD8_NEPPI|nr:hypothetical protein NPIL_424091 [Nephila pilipes]